MAATVRLVLWHWPVGERISHRGWNAEPWRDRDHPMSQFRFLVDAPADLADEIVRVTPGCEYADQ